MSLREHSQLWLLLPAAVLMAAAGCGQLPDSTDGGSSGGELRPKDYYASEIVSFEPGPGAGHGRGGLPYVVTGPPEGAASDSAARKVLSLGAGGTITLHFEEQAIVDGPGPDFVVFENPFLTDFEDDGVWEELGAVAVSRNGESWTEFDCSTTPATGSEADGRARWPGCAGWTPTRAYDPSQVIPLDPKKTGGDTFDLADVGLEEVRYVRIRDLSEEAMAAQGAAGFDLDGVGIVNGTAP